LLLALKREQFEPAVKNLFEIISEPLRLDSNLQTRLTFGRTEPGGYLQWNDTDYEEIRPFPFGPVHAGLIFQTSKFITGLGMSVFCSDEIEVVFKAVGFRWTVKEPRNSYRDRELA
jgi:hypothetical protein